MGALWPLNSHHLYPALRVASLGLPINVAQQLHSEQQPLSPPPTETILALSRVDQFRPSEEETTHAQLVEQRAHPRPPTWQRDQEVAPHRRPRPVLAVGGVPWGGAALAILRPEVSN